MSATFEPGTHVRAVIGLDGGSTSSKAVLIDESGHMLTKQYQLSKGNPIEDAKQLLAKIKAFVHDQGATLEVLGFGATGYAADVLQESLRADVNIVETVAHQMAAVKFFGDVDVICDIGGQDIKVLFMANGDIRNFRLSNQCSAGNGMLLQAMADQFGVPVTEYADVAFRAGLTPKFSYGCAVFLDADRVNFQKEGYSKEELLAGLAHGPAEERLAVRRADPAHGGARPPLRAAGRHAVQPRRGQGAGRLHQGARARRGDPRASASRRSRRDRRGARDAACRVAPRALDLRRARCRDRSRATSAGTTRARAAISVRTTAAAPSSTPTRPTAARSRYISGFSCEKGTVESVEALKTLAARRKDAAAAISESRRLREQGALPQLLHACARFLTNDTVIDDVEVRTTLFGGVKRTPVRRPFQRSSEAARDRRRQIQDRHPACAQLYSTAPIWRTYFEALGVPSEHIVFSDYTSEELWAEGGKYGSIDPCFPSKACQAHIHDLLFRKPRHRFNFIFFPCITHVPSFVVNTMDNDVVPDRRGRPESRARGVHEGDRLLRREGS